MSFWKIWRNSAPEDSSAGAKGPEGSVCFESLKRSIKRLKLDRGQPLTGFDQPLNGKLSMFLTAQFYDLSFKGILCYL